MGIAVAVEFVDVVETLMVSARDEMLEHRNNTYPHEAVGILCSDGSTYPLINQARSAHRFEVSQFLVREAIVMLNEAGKMPVAVYHSHPESASGPSTRDILLMQEMVGCPSIIVGVDGISAWMWDDRLLSVGSIPLNSGE